MKAVVVTWSFYQQWGQAESRCKCGKQLAR